MRKRRRYIITVTVSVIVAFLLTSLFLGATSPGQRVLLRMAAWAASSGDLTVKTGRLEGSLFSAGRISGVSLGDADGTWAEIGDIRFAWSPWSLLRGTLNIKTLEIGRLSIERKPMDAARADSGSGDTATVSRLAIPPMRIGNLTIGEIMLNEAVLGEKARLTLKAQFDAGSPAAAIVGSIRLTDLDRPNVIRANLSYLGVSGTLDVNAKAEEKAGGILSNLLDLKDGRGLRLTLNGSGTVSNWRGDWTLVTGEAPIADGNLRMNRRDAGLALTMAAKGEISWLVPEPYATILAGRSDLSVEARTLSDGRYRLDAVKLNAPRIAASASGEFDLTGFDGDLRLNIPDVAPLSRLAGRDLSGSLTLSANGRAGLDGSLDLAIDGDSEKLAAGMDLIGQLLAGAALDGTLTRDRAGMLRFDALRLRTDTASLAINGDVSAASNNLNILGDVPRLEQLLPESSGALRFDAAIDGMGEAQTVTVTLAAAQAAIRGKQLRDLVISYEGAGGINAQQGRFSAGGRLGEETLRGSGTIELGGNAQLAVREFQLALGNNHINADFLLPTNGEPHGNARIRLTDASRLAPILGVPVAGSATLDAQLSGTADASRVTIKAKAAKLHYDTIVLDDLDAALDISDVISNPLISGRARIKSVSAGVSRIANLMINAKPEADRTVFDLSARIDEAWQFGGKALVSLRDWQPDAMLEDFSLRNGQAALSQRGSAWLFAKDGALRLDGLVLTAGSGRIDVSIAVGDRLEGKIALKQFPANFAGVLAPDLAPRGAIEGTIALAGSTAAPEARYKLAWRDALLTGPLPLGFPALNLTTTGAFTGDDLTIDASASGPEGLNLKANGSIRTANIAASLNLKARGAVPLALASAFLAARGTQMSGRANVDLAITGPAEKPAINGRIMAAGATINDPPTGITLNDASLSARLSGGALHIEKLGARSEKDGAVTVTGTIGLLTDEHLPVDLKIKAEALRFNDHRVASGELGGDVALKGNLGGSSNLSGAIDIAQLDIQIPRSLPASVEALKLKHKNAPAYVAALSPPGETESNAKLSSTISLSLALRSANRIFVTGRGLDAQLGGELQLLGSADNPRAIGSFALERGRLAVLGRTLEFTSGSVNFSGDLDPVLNFLATTEVDGTKIEATVTGRASNPKLGFASTPELPEDEILALLLFNKSLGELSPLQIAQLASEVSDLGGLSGGPGILGNLKSSIGIDTLNLTTDEKGDAAVSAGSYLNEKVFVGVEQGSASDSSRVKVDLDITKNLKLRGQAGADGKSKVGVSVEWEY